MPLAVHAPSSPLEAFAHHIFFSHIPLEVDDEGSNTASSHLDDESLSLRNISSDSAELANFVNALGKDGFGVVWGRGIYIID